jgi:hypothetical protein
MSQENVEVVRGASTPARSWRRSAGTPRPSPVAARYGEEAEDEPDRLHSELFGGTCTGGLGLLRDPHDL